MQLDSSEFSFFYAPAVADDQSKLKESKPTSMKAFIDDTAVSWEDLTADDFAKVNRDDDT